MTRRAIQVVDLGFGDSGKGTMVDYLARSEQADLIVRFNGGPQAGHNVVLPDGRHHTFSQFGSASFLSHVRTLLSRFMLIEPYAMLNEARHLESVGVPDALERTYIDERCLVITPPQQIANRVRERSRGSAAHGTCGMGVGECMKDWIEHPELALGADKLGDRSAVIANLKEMLAYKRESLEHLMQFADAPEWRLFDDRSWIETAADKYALVARRAKIVATGEANRLLRESDCAIFEGAQGILLDERFGFDPHTTWSTTTFANADALLNESQIDASRQRIGVMRTYMTRHGVGPLVTEDDSLSVRLIEQHNSAACWQGAFRCGVLDLPVLRYAIQAAGGVDSLALTHLDRLPHLPSVICDSYLIDDRVVNNIEDVPEHRASSLFRAKPHFVDITTKSEQDWLKEMEGRLGAKVKYVSKGQTHLDKKTI